MTPSRDDPFVAAASTAVGGPVGRHALPHPFWTPLRVVLVMVTVAVALNLLHTAPCQAGAWWSGASYADLCYSDVPLGYVSGGHAEGLAPYARAGRYPQTTDPAPVALLAWGAAALARSLSASEPVPDRSERSTAELSADPAVREEAVTYYGVYALLMLASALVLGALLVAASGRRPFDAAAFALAPVLVAAATIGWDLFGVALAVAGGYAWSRSWSGGRSRGRSGGRPRGRTLACGLLLGSAVAVAVWPLAVLVAIVALAGRAGRLGRAATVGPAPTVAAVCSVTAVTWASWQLPPVLLAGDWWDTVNHSLDGGIGYGSLWWLATSYGLPVSSDVLVAVVALAVLAVAVAVLALVARAQAPPRWSQVVLLLLIGGLVVWPVYSPQYVLWLLPFAVLARPRWRDLLWWQAGELCYFLAVWWMLAGATANAGTVDRPYATAIVVRVAAELWFAGLVVRDIRRPRRDP